MQFQTIPLSKLVPSPENVRKTLLDHDQSLMT